MATFDSKTIVMMAENGHSVEIDGKKIQLTIVKEAVEAKPDDVRVFDVPSEIKISSDGNLYLHFNEYQSLWYDNELHCYGVAAGLNNTYDIIPCIATECKFEDLQEGDLFFATDDEKPDFTRLHFYNFLSNDKGYVWTGGRNVNILGDYKYKYYFKITPKP